MADNQCACFILLHFPVFQRFSSVGQINFFEFGFRTCAIKNIFAPGGLVDVDSTGGVANIFRGVLFVDGLLNISEIGDEGFSGDD